MQMCKSVPDLDIPSKITSSHWPFHSTLDCICSLRYKKRRHQIVPTPYLPKGTGSGDSLLPLSALIIVLDAVNVGPRGGTRLSFLTMGFFLYNCWRNRSQTAQGVQGAAVNSFSLWRGQPAELKGTVRMLLQLLNSKHHWEETSWDGAGGNGAAQLGWITGTAGLVLPPSGKRLRDPIS